MNSTLSIAASGLCRSRSRQFRFCLATPKAAGTGCNPLSLPRQGAVIDFLWPHSESPKIAKHGVDWIITNPPFRLAEQFVERAWQIKGVKGISMLVRTSFLEGCGRYERLFKPHPPTIVAQFVERVPMVKGRLSSTVSTATAYCWLVWMMGEEGTRLKWIPPCRRELERPADYPFAEAAE